MVNNKKQAEISAILTQRYNQHIELTELRGGRDKDVYLAKKCNGQNFVVLVNKKNTIMRKYRTLLSNDFQKRIYDKGLEVPDVIDIFELNNGIIVACHTYLQGKQIENLDKNTAQQCGIVIAKMHNMVASGNNYYNKYPIKYVFCGLIKYIANKMRWIKDVIFDENWKKLPQGLCHRDLNLTNFIFIDNTAYLIDFDRHRLWPFVYELCRFLKGKENVNFAEDILKGYSSVRKFNDEEVKYIVKKFPHLSEINF